MSEPLVASIEEPIDEDRVDDVEDDEPSGCESPDWTEFCEFNDSKPESPPTILQRASGLLLPTLSSVVASSNILDRFAARSSGLPRGFCLRFLLPTGFSGKNVFLICKQNEFEFQLQYYTFDELTSYNSFFLNVNNTEAFCLPEEFK